MNPYVNAIIMLLSGLGILLIGFKMLSDNIEKLANSRLKKMLNKTSKNYFVGVGIGAATTAIIQSSSATTVMIVGFVNAGIMNLFQATTMIMGANIGTTITAQIVALGSFNVSTYLMLFSIIGVVITMIVKKDRIKTVGFALCGLGLVFIALWMMQYSMKIFKESETLLEFLRNANNPILLLLFGIIFTAIVQSSSAASTILISMAAAGMTIGGSPNGILFVILGTNIGTTVTALLSSLGATPNAKRAAFIHFLFNCLGALIFLIILLIFPNFMTVTFARWFKDAPATQVAMFHTFFNIICTALFLPLTKIFVKVATLIIKDKQPMYKSRLIDTRLLLTPGIALNQALKETIQIGTDSMNLLQLSIESFIANDDSNNQKLKDTIKELDYRNQELLEFLVKISSQQISHEDEIKIGKLHKIINDFYREVEISDNMRKYLNTSLKNELVFSKQVYNQVDTLKNLLMKQFDNVKEIFSSQDKAMLEEVSKVEDEIDALRQKMTNEHIARLEKNECSPRNSGVFINMVSNLERAGDHLSYIASCILE